MQTQEDLDNLREEILVNALTNMTTARDSCVRKIEQLQSEREGHIGLLNSQEVLIKEQRQMIEDYIGLLNRQSGIIEEQRQEVERLRAEVDLLDENGRYILNRAERADQENERLRAALTQMVEAAGLDADAWDARVLHREALEQAWDALHSKLASDKASYG